MEIGEKEGFHSAASVFWKTQRGAVFFLEENKFSSSSPVSWQRWHCRHEAPWEEQAGDAPGGSKVLSQELTGSLFGFPFWMDVEVKEHWNSLWERRGWRTSEAAEASEDLFPLQGELSGTGTVLMGPGGSASLGFPFSATVSMSKPPRGAPAPLGKGDLRPSHVLEGGIGLLCTGNPEPFPGGGIASELAMSGSWGEKESKNFFPDALFVGWGLSKGAHELDYPLGMWDFFLFLVSAAEQKNHLIFLFTCSLEHSHIYPVFNHLC